MQCDLESPCKLGGIVQKGHFVFQLFFLLVTKYERFSLSSETGIVRGSFGGALETRNQRLRVQGGVHSQG